MSVSNRVFDFAEQIAAASSGALSAALVQSDLYEKLGDFKTVRVGDVQSAEFAPGIDGLTESNAVLTVQFLVKPSSQRTADLKAARLTTVEMAKEFASAIFANGGLNDLNGAPRVCDAQIIKYYGDQRKDVSTLKLPAAFLQLKINAR